MDKKNFQLFTSIITIAGIAILMTINTSKLWTRERIATATR
jgi:hypothetical protein